MPDTITRYGWQWPSTMSELDIEFQAIRWGGVWRALNTSTWVGNGLFYHYKRAMSLLWPEDDHHRWSDLMLEKYLEERLTVIMGARDSSKTFTMSKICLIDYWVFPDETLILMTSTTVQGLELRIWGSIKDLWRRARERYPSLAGNVVDAKHGLFTDDISDEETEVRVMGKGIIGIPLLTSQNEYQGMALKNFAGIKQKRRRLIGDELQFIHTDYLKVLDSLDKGDFKAGFLGNPIADNGKALDKVSEPEAGWGSEGEITKTTTWRNKYGGLTINLVGIDSPNFDPATRSKYPYMVDQKDVDRVSARPGGKTSVEWWSLIMGVRKTGVIMDRVLTVQMVEACGGFRQATWSGQATTKIYGVDAGFGGDACIRTVLEFGRSSDGQDIIAFGEQKEIPVVVGSDVTVEDQIAKFAKADCDRLGVLYENVFVECGMKATLAVSFTQFLSPAINAINFGGPATQRPVSQDMYIFDEKMSTRRLKTCYEHYSKFVTELAFSVRYIVESKQARSFPMRAAEEFQKRQTRFVYGDKYEIETKQEYKERNGTESPNYSDSCFEAGTTVSTTDGHIPIERIKVGDLVLTPFGPSPVVITHCLQSEETICLIFSDGTTLRGTPEHKIFTWDKGWVRMDTVSIDNETESVHNLPIWNLLNLLFTKDTRIGFSALVNIIATATTGTRNARDFFTDSFGRSTTGLFLKACASIIKMGIGRITASRIWKWFQSENIPTIIKLNSCVFPSIALDFSGIWTKHNERRDSGMVPRLDAFGTAAMLFRRGRTKSQLCASAIFAGNHSLASIQRLPNTVRYDAETYSLGKQLRLIIVNAAFAALRLLRTSIGKRGPVLQNVEHLKRQKPVNVYNLTLAEHNAYYANGILVKNCMIAVEGARRRGFTITKQRSAAAQASNQWLEDMDKKARKFQRTGELNFKA